MSRSCAGPCGGACGRASARPCAWRLRLARRRAARGEPRRRWPNAGKRREAPSGHGSKKRADHLRSRCRSRARRAAPASPRAAVAFYNPNSTPQQWITGGGVVWTSRGTKGIAAFHKMVVDRATPSGSTRRPRSWTRRTTSSGSARTAGDRGDALTLQDKQFNVKATATFRVFANGFAGVRYQLGTHDASNRRGPRTSRRR